MKNFFYISEVHCPKISYTENQEGEKPFKGHLFKSKHFQF